MAQTDETEKSVTFECKEKDCTEQVVYKQKVVLGLFNRGSTTTADKIVYLTCGNEHTHPYTIKGG